MGVFHYERNFFQCVWLFACYVHCHMVTEYVYLGLYVHAGLLMRGAQRERVRLGMHLGESSSAVN